MNCSIERRALFAVSAVCLWFALAGCSDDNSGRTTDAVDAHNDAAQTAAEQECRCYSEDLGLGSFDACVEELYEPEDLSSCEYQAVRCDPNNYRHFLECRQLVLTRFENCIDGCPSDPSACRQQRDEDLAACDGLRSVELEAALNACASGQTPQCAAPSTPDAADSGGQDSQDTATPDADAQQDTGPPPPSCGDGDLDTDEACEGFELRGKSCQSQGFYGGTLTCTDTCTLDTSDCEGRCGDGDVNGPEVCDDGVNDGSYGGCSGDCSARMDHCGDGVKNGPEECDGQDLGAATCSSLQAGHGTPDCTSSCNFDTSSCWRAEALTSGLVHACALDQSGGIHCWGGVGPPPPPSGSFVDISAGTFFTCALTTTGTVECWGNDGGGQTSGTLLPSSQVSSGAGHACALANSGDIDCWGYDTHGQASPPFGDFTQVSAGSSHTCALNLGGAVECWGLDAEGQASPPNGTFTQVAAGERHNCALNTSGGVECWGEDNHGQASPPSGTYTHVSAGESHTCALASDATIDCWGSNSVGQASPPAGSFIEIAAGGGHTCALTQGGHIECWGSNGDGQTSVP